MARLAPQHLHSMFSYRNEISNYSLRDSEGKLATPLTAPNQLCKKQFCYRGSVLWNSLPVELRKRELPRPPNPAAVISFRSMNVNP